MMTPGRRIGLVTSAELFPLLPQEELLRRAFEAKDWQAKGVVWTQKPAAEVATSFDAIVIRTPWDYHQDPARFLAWLDAIEAAGCRVVNPIETIRWNIDKGYLAELAEMGLSVVPTITTEVGEIPRLQPIMSAHGWTQAVVKPRISAGARRTWRVALDNVDAVQSFVNDAHDATTGWLVQPFLESIQTLGEWSLMYFDGRYSHAVRKRAKPGDYRVQDDHGGTVHIEEAPHDVMKAATLLMDTFPLPAPYLRLDLVETNDGVLLMEAEAIEPELFLDAHPDAPVKLAEAVLAHLT